MPNPTIYNGGAAVQVRVMASPGLPGQGVPAGGTTGQFLVKASGTDYDTGWVSVRYTAIGGLAAVLAGKANTVSPILVGTPEAETPDPGDDSARIATTEWVNGEIAGFLAKAGDTMTGPLGIFGGVMPVGAVGDPALIAHSVDGLAVGLGAVRWESGTGGSNIFVAKSRGATVGDFAAVQAGDQLGAINCAGADGAEFDRFSAGIRFFATENFVAGSNYGARVDIYSHATGSGMVAQRTASFDHSTGFSMYGPANIIFTPARHYRPRQYAAGSLPTAVSGDEIASADIVAATLVSDGARWLSPGVKVLAAVTANTTISIPPGWKIDEISFANTTANAVTGGIKIGTTSGATDVVAAQAVGANAIGTVPAADVLKKVFSQTVAQTLFVQAVTGWNGASVDISFSLRKVF